MGVGGWELVGRRRGSIWFVFQVGNLELGGARQSWQDHLYRGFLFCYTAEAFDLMLIISGLFAFERRGVDYGDDW